MSLRFSRSLIWSPFAREITRFTVGLPCLGKRRRASRSAAAPSTEHSEAAQNHQAAKTESYCSCSGRRCRPHSGIELSQFLDDQPDGTAVPVPQFSVSEPPDPPSAPCPRALEGFDDLLGKMSLPRSWKPVSSRLSPFDSAPPWPRSAGVRFNARLAILPLQPGHPLVPVDWGAVPVRAAASRRADTSSQRAASPAIDLDAPHAVHCDVLGAQDVIMNRSIGIVPSQRCDPSEFSRQNASCSRPPDGWRSSWNRMGLDSERRGPRDC